MIDSLNHPMQAAVNHHVEDIVLETVATCIVSMLDTFTKSETKEILDIVHEMLNIEQGEGEEGGNA